MAHLAEHEQRLMKSALGLISGQAMTLEQHLPMASQQLLEGARVMQQDRVCMLLNVDAGAMHKVMGSMIAL